MVPPEVRRDRLISLLEQRWSHGVTVVVGGAGLGKSTAIRHAHLDSLAGGRTHELLVDARAVTAPTVEPGTMSVLIDHADHAPPSTLELLLERVPHITIVCRRWPDLALERRHLDGDVFVIGADEFLFARDEQQLLPLPLAEWDGWVGAALLDNDLGEEAVRRFVGAETTRDQDELLDLVIAADGLSDPAATTVLGRPVTIATELADIPTLRSQEIDGVRSWSVGASWARLRPELPEERVDRAISTLLETNQTRAAAGFTAKASPEALKAVQRAVALDRLCVDSATLARLATAGTPGAATALLKGFVARTSSPGLDRSLALWEEALDLATEEDDSVLALEALGHLAGPRYLQNDNEAAAELLAHAYRHVDRVPELQQVLVMLAGVLASPAFGQDPEDTDRLRALEHPDLPTHWHGLWHYLMAWTLLAQGNSDAALHIAAAGADAMPYETVHGLERLILFRSGLPVPEVDWSTATVGNLTVGALIAAIRGRDEEARALLSRARDRAPSFRTLEVDLPLELTEAILVLWRDGASEAGLRLRAVVDEFAASPRAATWFSQVAWLFDECGVNIDTKAEGGDLWARDHDLAASLIAWRRSETRQRPELSARYGARDLVAALGLRGGVELAIAWTGQNYAAGKRIVHGLFSNEGEFARDIVRELASRPENASSEIARRMLAQVAVPPDQPYRLHLLGSQRVTRGDEPVEHPNWRREQVRGLLALVAAQGPITRERVSAELWPDADETAARNRLRTTLNRLMVALEFNHQPREASAFLTLTGDELSLDLDHISIDAREFEQALDQAAALDRAGCEDEALRHLRAGLEMWKGDYLEDQRYADWAATERSRLISRFTQASLRAADLLETSGHLDEALRVVSRVITFEPWCEPAHRARIRLHIAAGNRSAARRAIDQAEAALDEIGGPVEPLHDLIDGD